MLTWWTMSGQGKWRPDVALLVMFLTSTSPPCKEHSDHHGEGQPQGRQDVLDSGCTGTHAVVVRNHRELQRSPPSNSRHGGANTSHSTAQRTSVRSMENWHVPGIAVTPFQPQNFATCHNFFCDKDMCWTRPAQL